MRQKRIYAPKMRKPPTKLVAARSFVAYVWRSMPGPVVSATLFLIIQGLTGSSSIALLVPLLELLAVDSSGNQWVDFLSRTGLPPTLPTVLLLFASFSFLQGVCAYQAAVLGEVITQNLTLRLRERLFLVVTRARWDFLAGRRASDLLHRMTDEIDRCGWTAAYFLSAIGDGVWLLALLALALSISAEMTLLALLLAGLLLLVVGDRFGQAYDEGAGLSDAQRDLYNTFGEHLSALKVARFYGTERHFDHFKSFASGLAQAQRRAVHSHAWGQLKLQSGTTLLLVSLLYVSVSVLSLPIAHVLVLLYAFARLAPTITRAHLTLQQFMLYLPAYRNVLDTFGLFESAQEPLDMGRAQQLTGPGNIELTDVVYAYPSEPERRVVDNVTLQITAGRVTALVGPSGAGKSSLADLVSGLLTPIRGMVRVDDEPLEAGLLHAWRKRVGYVSQDTFLFCDTIRANLQWVRPDATEIELLKAIDLADARDFVARLPAGLDTTVGDRGAQLSGGERQRLALARAFLRRPSVLVLDEVSSALDVESEQRIFHSIRESGLTTLIVTHRLALAAQADQVFVIGEGRVVESGPGSSLLQSKSGRFLATTTGRVRPT